MDVRPIEQGATATGTLLLRDITELKEREQELDLLKQVLSRVQTQHQKRVDDPTWTRGDHPGAGRRRPVRRSRRRDRRQHRSHPEPQRERQRPRDDHRRRDGRRTDPTRPRRSAVCSSVRRRPPGRRDRYRRPRGGRFGTPSIERALEELVQNAVAHHDGSDSIRIDVRARPTDGTVRLVVADDGPGIDSHEIETLQAGRKPTSSTAPGSDSGWSISSFASPVARSGSTTTPNSAARVCIELPRAD